MCGISGVFLFSNQRKETLQVLETANNMLKQRGPDGGGIYKHSSTGLGHRRLSIIDVSCAGDQPMTTTDDRYTIVFNGEIFNYQELKEKLTEQEKQKLRSTSDTEVFLLLYARLKEKVFPLLRGFFAAAIYDKETDELVLVRDRYGKKPLLIYRDEEQLCFASEMKSLFSMGVPKKINWNILTIYLQLNYIPQPFSMLEGVTKMPPGHFMRIKGKEVVSEAYYTLRTKPEEYGNLSYDAAKEKLVHLMDESVKLRMIADVPLGAFLSGGIDSSVVVALASRYTNNLRTFSIGYKDEPYFDETKYARLVADRYKTDHTVFSLSNNDFLEHLYNVLDYIDEPFADSSALPVFILSHHTRKHVTVALSGDGGDEVFGGYNKHSAEWRMRKGGLLNNMVKAGYPLWNMLPKSRSNPLTNKFRQLHRFASGARLSDAERYWQWATFNNQGQAVAMLNKNIRQQIDKTYLGKIQTGFTKDIKGEDFNEVLLADMNLVLLSDMLTKVDLMSMANSLEIRSPFLDSEVVEFAFGLPVEYKIDGQMKKKIVQDAFRKHLPEELYNRPKQGFEIPLLGWFRKELWSLINDDLLKDSFVEEQGIFELKTIQELKKQLHSSNPGDSHATIWALIVFQYWWKRYIAG